MMIMRGGGTTTTSAMRRKCTAVHHAPGRSGRLSSSRTKRTRRVGVDAARGAATGDEEGEVDEMTGEIRRAYGKRSEKDVRVRVNGEEVSMHVFEVQPEDADVREGGRQGVTNVVCLHSVLTNSYIYRGVLPLLAKEGMRAIAIDFAGHGKSFVPSGNAGFDYSPDAYIASLDAIFDALNLGDGDSSSSTMLITQGFVLGQYGMLFAARHPERIGKLVVMNTPLVHRGLPDPLAAYKNPIMKAFMTNTVDAGIFVAGGGPYALAYADAEAFREPYSKEGGEAAVNAMKLIMDKYDPKAVAAAVDSAYSKWRKDTLMAWGGSDKYISDQLGQNDFYNWLETKRTNIRGHVFLGKVGHFPQVRTST